MTKRFFSAHIVACLWKFYFQLTHHQNLIPCMQLHRGSCCFLYTTGVGSDFISEPSSSLSFYHGVKPEAHTYLLLGVTWVVYTWIELAHLIFDIRDIGHDTKFLLIYTERCVVWSDQALYITCISWIGILSCLLSYIKNYQPKQDNNATKFTLLIELRIHWKVFL